jgi:hypothetical protein
MTDISWLDEPYALNKLSLNGRAGVSIAVIMRRYDLRSVREFIEWTNGPSVDRMHSVTWTPRKVYRRLARAKFEITRPRRCVCGCAEPIPAYARADTTHATPACRQRKRRRRR